MQIQRQVPYILSDKDSDNNPLTISYWFTNGHFFNDNRGRSYHWYNGVLRIDSINGKRCNYIVQSNGYCEKLNINILTSGDTAITDVYTTDDLIDYDESEIPLYDEEP